MNLAPQTCWWRKKSYPGPWAATAFMTKDEFMANELAWKRYRDKFDYLWMAGLSIFFLWSYLASGRIDTHWTSPLWQACLAIYLMGGMVIMFWLNIRRMRQLGMFCPRCKWGQYFLMNPVVKRRILATGKCRCGQQIIESPEGG